MAKFIAAEESTFDPVLILVILGLLVVVFFVVPMFTRKKQKDSYSNLLNSIKVGNKVKTIGGIIGTVVEIIETSPTDKNILIETGTKSEKHLMLFDINAVYQVITNPALSASSKEEAEQAIKENNALKAKQEEEARLAAEKAAALKAEAFGKAPLKSEEPEAGEENLQENADEAITASKDKAEESAKVEASLAVEKPVTEQKTQTTAKKYNKKS